MINYAGFAVEDGKVIMIAPILKKNFLYWQTQAIKIKEGI